MTAPTTPAPPGGDEVQMASSGDAGRGGSKPAVELDGNTAQWLLYIRQCDAQIKQLEEAKAVARKHVEAALGDAEVGTVDGQPAVRWTWVRSSRFQTTKFREQHPDLYAEYTSAQVTRRFIVGGDA